LINQFIETAMSTIEKSRLGASIVRTGRLLTNSVNNHFLAGGANITFEQLEALLHIALNADTQIIQRDLAELLHKNKSGILRTIDLLEKKQFVKRSPVPGDRRKNIIEATPKGTRVAKAAIESFRQIEQSLIKKISPEELLICDRVLSIIRQECEPLAETFKLKKTSHQLTKKTKRSA
jgi:DNA-binding MarR family transcriptional regulator